MFDSEWQLCAAFHMCHHNSPVKASLKSEIKNEYKES